jgi:hypothetical protein
MLSMGVDRVVVIVAGGGFVAVMPGAVMAGMLLPAVAGVSGSG